MNKTPRRQFLFQTMGLIGLAGLASKISLPTNLAAAEELSLIDMTEKIRKDATNKECVKQAKAIGYIVDLKKAPADLKKKETRTVGSKTFKPEDQTCDTCLFYDFKKDGKPTCQLIPKCLVHAKGSCVSWVGKA